jgi:hypothetical protein
MNIAAHTAAEIQDALDHLHSWSHRGLALHTGFRPLEEAKWALECAGTAQRAAEAHSRSAQPRSATRHAPSDPMQGLQAPTPMASPKQPAEIADLIQDILCNCVAQDGTDFCPAKARRTLERLAYCLCRMEIDHHHEAQHSPTANKPHDDRRTP